MSSGDGETTSEGGVGEPDPDNETCESCGRNDNPPYSRWADDVYTCKDCSPRQPSREELLNAMESLTGGSPGVALNGEEYRSDDAACFFCGGTARPDAADATDFVDAFLHWPDCAWITARSLLTRAGR